MSFKKVFSYYFYLFFNPEEKFYLVISIPSVIVFLSVSFLSQSVWDTNVEKLYKVKDKCKVGPDGLLAYQTPESHKSKAVLPVEDECTYHVNCHACRPIITAVTYYCVGGMEHFSNVWNHHHPLTRTSISPFSCLLLPTRRS